MPLHGLFLRFLDGLAEGLKFFLDRLEQFGNRLGAADLEGLGIAARQVFEDLAHLLQFLRMLFSHRLLLFLMALRRLAAFALAGLFELTLVLLARLQATLNARFFLFQRRQLVLQAILRRFILTDEIRFLALRILQQSFLLRGVLAQQVIPLCRMLLQKLGALPVAPGLEQE